MISALSFGFLYFSSIVQRCASKIVTLTFALGGNKINLNSLFRSPLTTPASKTILSMSARRSLHVFIISSSNYVKTLKGTCMFVCWSPPAAVQWSAARWARSLHSWSQTSLYLCICRTHRVPTLLWVSCFLLLQLCLVFFSCPQHNDKHHIRG